MSQIEDPELESWRRRLGRIRLGAAPVEQQLEKYRRSTIALMIVLACIGTFLFVLFVCFRRPDIGLGVAAAVAVPAGLLSLLEYRKLARRSHGITSGQTQEKKTPGRRSRARLSPGRLVSYSPIKRALPPARRSRSLRTDSAHTTLLRRRFSRGCP